MEFCLCPFLRAHHDHAHAAFFADMVIFLDGRQLMTGVFTRVLSQPIFQTRRDPSCSRVCGNVDPGNLPQHTQTFKEEDYTKSMLLLTAKLNTATLFVSSLNCFPPPSPKYRQVKQDLVCLLRLLCSACIHFLLSCMHILSMDIRPSVDEHTGGDFIHCLPLCTYLSAGFFGLCQGSLHLAFLRALMYVAFFQEQSENAARDHF